MSNKKGKIIEVESDEEVDSYPHMLREYLLDPQIPLSNVGPSSIENVLMQPSLEATPSPYGN